MRYFTFNGRDSRELFPLTNSITRPYLPPITVPSFAVANRAGAVSVQRNDIGTREIDVAITFMMDSHAGVRQRVREMSDFLIYKEDKILVFSDEPDLQYYARFNQSKTDLEEVAYMGQGTLHFTCYDPFAYALEEKSVAFTEMEQTIVNEGSVETYPRFRIVPAEDSTWLKVTNVSLNKFIYYNASWLTGDALIIDHTNNRVYNEATEESLVKNITLDSEFFELQPGENVILIQNQNASGAGVASALTVNWRERFF